METHDEDILRLYYHEGLVTYDTDGGRMCCPPHVQTPQDCIIFFGNRPMEFIRDPYERALKPDQLRAAERRAREMRELVARQRAEERKRLSEERRAAARAASRKTVGPDMRYTSGNWRGHVAQYTLGGKLVKTYKSARHAAREIGAGLTSVVYACRDPRRSSHGYQWRWYEGDTPAEKVGRFIDGRKLAAQARARRQARSEKRKEVA